MNIFRRIDLWVRSWGCPRFYEDMPKENRQGKWEVGSVVYSPWHEREADCEIFEGSLIDAYLRARELALLRDWKTPHDRDGELGIRWFVRGI